MDALNVGMPGVGKSYFIRLMRILKVAMAITAFCIYGSLFAALNGKGTEAEPYLIASAADFAQTGTDSIYYQLTANFDLPNPREINFNGCLDGAGCTITISASNTLGYGLFNTTQTNSVIKNLNVIISKEIEISSSFSSGGICGENFGTISGCSVDVTGAISSYYSGGICGLNENSGAIFCVAVEKVDGAKIEGKNAGLYVVSVSQPVQKLGSWHVTNIDLGMPLHSDCYYVKVRMVAMSPGEFYTIQAIDSNYNSFPFPKNTAFQLDTAFTDSHTLKSALKEY